MLRRVVVGVALSAAAVLLAGCGSSGVDPGAVNASVSAAYTSGMVAQKSSDEAAASSSSAAASEAAAAATSSAAAALHGPGETVDDGLGQTVTYYSMQRPAAPNAPKPESAGTEWVAADVKVCYGPGAASYDANSSWVLVDANNGKLPALQYGVLAVPLAAVPVRRRDGRARPVRPWLDRLRGTGRDPDRERGLCPTGRQRSIPSHVEGLSLRRSSCQADTRGDRERPTSVDWRVE